MNENLKDQLIKKPQIACRTGGRKSKGLIQTPSPEGYAKHELTWKKASMFIEKPS